MAGNTIEDFWVGLGFKVDSTSERRFHDTVRSATTQSILLADTIKSVAETIARGMVAIVQQFDSLYYVSQRTGTSVQNIKGLGYALSQVGGTAGQAAASLENFTASLRTNPGLRQLVADLKVTTTAGGKARDSLDVMMDTVAALNKQPYHVGVVQAGLFGIDEKTFNTLTTQTAQIKAFRDEYAKTAKGIGLDNAAAAKASVAFSQALGSLQATVTAVAEKLGADLMPILTKYLMMAQGWVSTHLPQIEETVRAIGNGVTHFVTTMGEIVTALKPLGLAFQSIAESLTGEKGLKASMELFAYWLVGTWLVKILGAFSALGVGWAGLLLRLGIPVGIGIAASGGGHMNPEGYKEALQNDPARAKADAELNANGGAAKRWWKRTMPSWLGGDAAGEGEKSPEAAARRANPAAATPNANYTGSNANILKQAASDLGTSPEDLATVISYESKFDPKRWGGAGGNYLGLIQFGGPERKQFGVNENQTFAEQMPSVVKYLKTRGFKPGMNLNQLYATINGGNPYVNQNKSDGNGTIGGHVERMRLSEAERVRKFLAAADQPEAPQAPAPQAPPIMVNLPRVAAAVGKFDLNGITGAPAMGSTSWDNRTTNTTNHVSQDFKVSIDGARDPSAVVNEFERRQGQLGGSTIRDLSSNVR